MISVKDNNLRFKVGLFFALVLTGASSPAQSLPAASQNPVSAKTVAKNSVAKTTVVKSNRPSEPAVKDLEAKLAANPKNADVHLLLGKAYLKSKNNLKAREHFRLAVRLGHGSPSAQKANLALMSMPSQMIKPKTGPQTRMIAAMLGLGRTRGLGGAAMPTVIDFYADWCQPCKQLDSALAKVKTTYNERVTFMRVDVDDPNSQPLMDQYDVSPIPTMVFLNPDGEVASYSIGITSESNIASSINKILK
ncbi:MAG: thioredoxin domain-containing protein [Candidatus Melainabacteria bacterium]|nr:thioredoxin domain-containing protein [Candidatus Melainabacteria bacterium]